MGVRGGVLLVVSEELLEGPSAWRSQGDLWVYHGVYLVDLGEVMSSLLGITSLGRLWWSLGVASSAGGVDPAGIGDRGRGSDTCMSVVQGGEGWGLSGVSSRVQREVPEESPSKRGFDNKGIPNWLLSSQVGLWLRLRMQAVVAAQLNRWAKEDCPPGAPLPPQRKEVEWIYRLIARVKRMG